MAKSPDAFRTIREVSEWLDTPAHVLRFWESKFRQVAPVKRAGGRRYYRPDDMLLLGGIKKLLHKDGMTIKGVVRLLRSDGIKPVQAMSQPLDGNVPANDDVSNVSPKISEAPAPQSETVSPPVIVQKTTAEMLNIDQLSASTPQPVLAAHNVETTTPPAPPTDTPELTPHLEPEVAATAQAVSAADTQEPNLFSLLDVPSSPDTSSVAPTEPLAAPLDVLPTAHAPIVHVAPDPQESDILLSSTPVLSSILEAPMSELIGAQPALEVAAARLETLRARMISR